MRYLEVSWETSEPRCTARRYQSLFFLVIQDTLPLEHPMARNLCSFLHCRMSHAIIFSVLYNNLNLEAEDRRQNFEQSKFDVANPDVDSFPSPSSSFLKMISGGDLSELDTSMSVLRLQNSQHLKLVLKLLHLTVHDEIRFEKDLKMDSYDPQPLVISTVRCF